MNPGSGACYCGHVRDDHEVSIPARGGNGDTNCVGYQRAVSNKLFFSSLVAYTFA
jgi:hypothetical protein